MNAQKLPLGYVPESLVLFITLFPNYCLAHGEGAVVFVAGIALFHFVIPFVVKRHIKQCFLCYLALYVLVLTATWYFLLSANYMSTAFYFYGLGVPFLFWVFVAFIDRYITRRS